MQLSWREKKYNFNIKKLSGGQEEYNRNSDIDKNFYAVDTESVICDDDRYEIQCFQTSSEFGEQLYYVEHKENSFEVFMNVFFDRYYEYELENKVCFMWCHNLGYDWLQFIKDIPPLLALARTGIGLEEDLKIWEHDDYTLILKKGGLFIGNAPHFSLIMQTSKRKKLEIRFRDTFSFFPSALSKLGKQFGFEEQKLERQEDLGRRDFRKEKMNKDKAYFEKYAKRDPFVTRKVAEEIRHLHQNAHLQKIRVSAPSFAINVLLHSCVPAGVNLVTGINDESIMQLILDSYAGGRTGGIYHGKVEDISVLDFHSSYPTSMTSLPSFTESMQYVRYPNPEELEISEILELIDETHVFIRCSGIEHDKKYPSLIKSVKGMLCPVYGEFHDIATTGVEFYVGVKSGTLEITKVTELVALVDMDEDVIKPFKLFAESAYHRKAESEKGSSNYVSAKLELNSCYGKLIESRSDTPVFDEVGNYDVPYVEEQKTEFAQMYYAEYIEGLKEENPSFEEKYEDLCQQVYDSFPPEKIKSTLFKNITLTELTYGYYAIPASASLITGTSRGRLLALMKCTGSIYWDTDSGFVERFDRNKFNKQLEEGNKLLPPYVVPLAVGEELGKLDIEIEHANGYLAGVKRYYIKSDGHVKKALHGIPTAPFDQAEEMIKALATGKDYSYKGRGKPTTAKESKTVDEIGFFKSRDYVSQFTLDKRLTWKKEKNGFVGELKEIEEIKNI